ncbi:MAG: sugar transferase [Clostridia bacterium]|nr:sugar transferase [Clostridia bacterium]
MTGFFMKLKRTYKLVIVIADLLIIYLSYVAAFYLKFKGSPPDYNYSSFTNAAPYILVASIIYIDMNKVLSFYRKSVYDVLKSLVYVICLLCITTISITYMLQGFSFPRTVLIMVPFIQFVLLGLFHVFLLYISRRLSVHKKVMIICKSSVSNVIVEKINTFLKNEEVDKRLILDLSQEKVIMKRLKDMDEVYISSDIPAELKAEIINRCMGRKQVIYMVPEVFEISLVNSKLVQLEDTPAFMVGVLGLTTEQVFFKRVFDVLVSIVGLAVLSPLMLITALLIKVTSKGPAIYKQERITKGNKAFNVYKFRTMYQDAESLTGPVLSIEKDPRVTWMGRILRKTRIDELPQLFNVLYGSMSLVGPRPERTCFVEQFSQDLPEYNHRFIVKAGITGYAQIYGNYSTTPEDKLRYDLMYIRNYSLLLDIKLIFKTMSVLFTPGSVYKSNKDSARSSRNPKKDRSTASKQAV